MSPARRSAPRSADVSRCAWARSGLMIAYHDREWGVPVRDDRVLFEFLVLEGAQAGLSWETILRKRENYRAAFDGFDPEKIARYTPRRVERLMADPGIVRNRLKIESTISNARAFLDVVGRQAGRLPHTEQGSRQAGRRPRTEQEGSFAELVWGFVGGRPIVNRWRTPGDLPARTAESDAMSKELKKRGFRFVGSTICYAFMQAVGMVNDHAVGCFRHRELIRSAGRPTRITAAVRAGGTGGRSAR